MSVRYAFILVVLALCATALPVMAQDRSAVAEPIVLGAADDHDHSHEGFPTDEVPRPIGSPVGSVLLDGEELYPLVFPVVGDNHYSDTWGAARSGGRTHQGVDILADKMVPVVAAASGTVGWMHNEQGGNCCAMALIHDDGWQSWYIHLNNDTPGTDDGQGYGFVDGLESGVHVDAGQLIGWVGDSGNAEATVSHLHFELHQPDGTPINPYPHVVEGLLIDEPGDAPAPRESGSGEGGTSVTFSDVSGSVHAESILQLAELGITGGCAPDLYCPDDPVTRAQMATFLTRALDLPIPEADTFSDDDGSTHEPNIEALAAAEITLGCGGDSYCPGDEVTRAQMATFLVRALELASVAGDSFDDDDGSTHESNIEALAAAQVTLGCGTRAYCPNDPVTRAQMATFLIRALDAGLASRPDGRLVPAEGVLTGVLTDGDVAGYEAKVGREMDLIPLSFDGALDVDAIGAVADSGRIPFVTWTPGEIDDALVGNLDAYIASVAADFAASGHPVFLRFWPGLDGAAASPDDVATIWSGARNAFDGAEAANVAWVWMPDDLAAAGLPGDVDWLGATVYGDACLGGTTTDFAIAEFMDAATELGEYPVAVAGWGVGPVQDQADAQAAFVASIGPALEEYPQVAALIADTTTGGCDWDLDEAGFDALADLLGGLTVDRDTLTAS
jgi:hypothetical protein